ncbi:MAG: hypothetical protein IPK73_30205 [Candidatus Obscuribacter sp.]|jgi:hypothetical protein|nr:hypothetical protein [Candidatus Obscuribacter sp.]
MGTETRTGKVIIKIRITVGYWRVVLGQARSWKERRKRLDELSAGAMTREKTRQYLAKGLNRNLVTCSFEKLPIEIGCKKAAEIGGSEAAKIGCSEAAEKNQKNNSGKNRWLMIGKIRWFRNGKEKRKNQEAEQKQAVKVPHSTIRIAESVIHF